jgi:hypothetical protein
MSNKISLKRSSIPGKIPVVGDLEYGELALNYADNKLYFKDSTNTISTLAAVDGSTDISIIPDNFTGDGSTTSFTLSRTPTTDSHTFIAINGVVQSTSEYSISGNILLFTVAPALNDLIETRVISSKSSTVELRDYKKYIFNITSTVSTISGANLLYDIGFLDVYLNGIRLVEGDDYTATDRTTINLTSAALNTDTVEVLSYGRAYIIDQTSSWILSSAATTTTAVDQVIDTFNVAEFSSMKFIIQIKNGSDIHCTELLLMHDGTTVYTSEYGTMFSALSLGSFDASITSGICSVLFTPVNTNTNITIKRVGLSV